MPPRVSVIVLTYRRLEALKRTVDSFRRYVDIPDYELIICDDGSSASDRREIRALEADQYIWNDRVGYGRNANSGIKAARGELLFHLEDDLVVLGGRHFLVAGMDVLGALPELGAIKYDGWWALPRVRARRSIGPYAVEILPFPAATTEGIAIFRYSNRPHLKTRRFHEVFGLYPEGYSPFLTECLFTRRVNARRSLRLGWIRDSVWFWPLGERYGTTEHDSFKTAPMRYVPES